MFSLFLYGKLNIWRSEMLRFVRTVNIEIFAQYIFSRILCMALDVHKFDVNGNFNHKRTNIIKPHGKASWGLICENLAAQKYLHLQ